MGGSPYPCSWPLICSCAHLIIVACIIIALSCILLLVRAKFAKISFHDEFVDYSPCFLLPRSNPPECTT
jgi:hypothetical protein